MTLYTLWNTKDQRALKHPKYGVYTVDSKAEAEQALGDLFDYLDHVGLPHLKTNFRYIEVDQIKEQLSN